MNADSSFLRPAAMAVLLLALAATPIAAAQSLELQADAIAGGRFSYATELKIGDTRVEIESVREILTETINGAAVLSITTTSRTGMGDTIDRLHVDAETLYPLTREIIQGLSRMTLDYQREHVTGLIQSAGQSIRVDLHLEQPAYAGDAGLDTLLAALPLAAGLTGKLSIIETDVDVHVQEFQFSVAEAETVTVPAGTFRAWPVRVQAVDDADYHQTLWLTAASPRVFLQAEAPVPREAGGGSLITRLTESDPVPPENP